jgi:hypothetical protein
MTTATITELAKALAKFHASAPAIIKDSTNPHYRNAYASLAGILDAIRVPLAENGLSVVQLLGQDSISTMLLHTSGEYIETTAPLLMVKQDAQSYGSASSYQRRYSILALLNLSASDDDGQAATAPAQVKATAPRATKVKTPIVVPEGGIHLKAGDSYPPAPAQDNGKESLKALFAKMDEAGIPESKIITFLREKDAITSEVEYLADVKAPILKRLVEKFDENFDAATYQEGQE